MRALKAVVLSLGALCVVAFGVLVYLVIAGMGAKTPPLAAPEAAAPASPPAAPPVAGLRWADLSLGQPAGTRIVSIAPAGALLAVQVERPGGAGAVIIVDPASGQIRGRIETGAVPQ
jgi:hypothetical protein